MDAYPFVIGIGFLIPLDLLFSCWTFYWFYKIQILLGSIMGWRSLPGFPYATQQAFGAYVGLLVFALWAGRRHLFRVLKGAFYMGNASDRTDESDEPMTYRWAFWGMVGGVAFLSLFAHRAGMSLYIAPLFFIIYYII